MSSSDSPASFNNVYPNTMGSPDSPASFNKAYQNTMSFPDSPALFNKAYPNPMSLDSSLNVTALSKKCSKDLRRRNTKAEAAKGISPRRLACDICRERKVRCDRAVPKCGRCGRLGNQCSYHGRTRTKASQADLPRQLAEIQDRLAQAEALLASNTKSISKPDRSISLSDHPWQPEQSFQPFQEHGIEYGIGMQTNVPAATNFPEVSTALTSQDTFAFTTFDWTSIETPTLKANAQADDTADPATVYSTEVHTPLDTTTLLLDSNGGPQHVTALPPQIPDICEISAEQMAYQHSNYFDFLYPHMPILSKERFFHARMSSRSSAMRGLEYAVALVGALIEPNAIHLQRACYSMARTYVEMCERDEEGSEFASLGTFQALLFIIRYELTARKFTRAWMTLGRAVRLAKILNLNEMDRRSVVSQGLSELQQLLPNTQDPSVLEERRRSLWVLYILEGDASSRIGFTCQLQDDQILAALPSPGSLDDDFQPLAMAGLSDTASLQGIPHISSFAGKVLIVSLARQCYEHERAQSVGYWDRHYNIARLINDRSSALSNHLTAKAVQEDAVAFSLYLNLCAIEIFLHEAAIDEVKKEGIPKLVAEESRKRSAAAALKISSALRMNWPTQRSKHNIFTLQGSFICCALVMGIKALTRNLVEQLDADDGASNGAANSLRLLLLALDQADNENGRWQASEVASGSARILKTWDERQGCFHMSA